MQLNKQYLAKIRFREDTAENWKISNPILSSSEPGREVDTGIVKVGDGKTAWLDLKPINGSKIIPEPEADGKVYGRYAPADGDTPGWAEITVKEAPEDNKAYVRQNKDWTSIDLDNLATIFKIEDKTYNLQDVYNSIPKTVVKDLDELLMEPYDKEIDMGYTITNANEETKQVYGIRKLLKITADINKVDSTTLAIGVEDVIRFGGFIDTGKAGERIILPCKEVDLRIDTLTKTLFADSKVETSERVSSALDIWIFYTKI